MANYNNEAAAIAAARASLNKRAYASMGGFEKTRNAALMFLNSRRNVKTASQQSPLGLTIMNKIASRDLGGLRVLCAIDGLQKIAEQAATQPKNDKAPEQPKNDKAPEQKPEAGQGAGKSTAGDSWKDSGQSWKNFGNDVWENIKRVGMDAWNGANEWLADPTNQKQLATGALTGGGLYGLSWLLPGARHTHGLRLLASILGGVGAGMYGDNIFNWIAGKGFNSDESIKEYEEQKRLNLLPEQIENNPEFNTPPEEGKSKVVTASYNKAAALRGILARHLA